MAVFSILFSPTGGTKKVAEIIVNKITDEFKTIDLCKNLDNYSAYMFNKDDLCIFSVPSYAGRVPKPAAERVSKMKGNGARAVIVTVYGNRAFEDTIIELYDILKEAGFKPISAVAAIAEHSIVHEFGNGRPDMEDLDTLSDFAVKIKEKYESRSDKPFEVKGNRPYRQAGGNLFVPYSDDKCIGCQRCAKACPVGAISVEKPAVTDENKCILCMRCLNICDIRRVDTAKINMLKGKIAKACEERKENELFI